MGFKVRLLEGKEARSFLKKRTKKLLYVVCVAGEVSDSGADVLLLFQTSSAFLSFRPGPGRGAHHADSDLRPHAYVLAVRDFAGSVVAYCVGAGR
jgi:hypothetical protein